MPQHELEKTTEPIDFRKRAEEIAPLGTTKADVEADNPTFIKVLQLTIDADNEFRALPEGDIKARTELGVKFITSVGPLMSLLPSSLSQKVVEGISPGLRLFAESIFTRGERAPSRALDFPLVTAAAATPAVQLKPTGKEQSFTMPVGTVYIDPVTGEQKISGYETFFNPVSGVADFRPRGGAEGIPQPDQVVVPKQKGFKRQAIGEALIGVSQALSGQPITTFFRQHQRQIEQMNQAAVAASEQQRFERDTMLNKVRLQAALISKQMDARTGAMFMAEGVKAAHAESRDKNKFLREQYSAKQKELVAEKMKVFELKYGQGVLTTQREFAELGIPGSIVNVPARIGEENILGGSQAISRGNIPVYRPDRGMVELVASQIRNKVLSQTSLNLARAMEARGDTMSPSEMVNIIKELRANYTAEIELLMTMPGFTFTKRAKAIKQSIIDSIAMLQHQKITLFNRLLSAEDVVHLEELDQGTDALRVLAQSLGGHGRTQAVLPDQFSQPSGRPALPNAER